LNHRLKHGIEIIRDYGDLPAVECLPAQVNQVFMNILSNAIDALESNQEASSPSAFQPSLPDAVLPDAVLPDTGLSNTKLSNTKLSNTRLSNTRLSNTKLSNTVPRIRIQTRVADNTAVVSIADNGSGIAPEVQRRLFDPFFTTKPIGKGTGLGLAICYQIVQKHSGSIQIESQLGQGTTFHIHIPLQFDTMTAPMTVLQDD
jgi:signal transduction histidine kinase